MTMRSKAVVDEGEQVAEQLSEQFHGNPRTARSGSKNDQARSGQADRRGQEFSSRRRGALYSAPSSRLRQPHRHHRSADPVLHQNRRCLVARPRRSVRRKAGSRGESEPIHIEETDTTFAIGWKGRYRIEGPAFIYSDEDTGRVATILGYLTDKLTQAV